MFAFGAESGDEHMGALQDVAKFLSIEENVNFLMACTDEEIVLKKLLNY